VLRFFEELSVEETAEVMNCAPGTIKATVHQALRSLRRRITRTGDAAADRRDTTV
jgi:DNA-directed RNA polymerase specialized sigma24 family protein